MCSKSETSDDARCGRGHYADLRLGRTRDGDSAGTRKGCAAISWQTAAGRVPAWSGRVRLAWRWRDDLVFKELHSLHKRWARRPRFAQG